MSERRDAAPTAAPTAAPAAAPAGPAGPTEFSELLANVLAVVLEGSSTNLATATYYRTLASYVLAHDAKVSTALLDAATAVRRAYRSAREHAQHVERVPVVKCADRRVQATLDTDDCAICLKPLAGAGRLARLRAAKGPGVCGHFFHAACVGEWELRSSQLVKACPLCREPIGVSVRLWDDHEASVPRF